MTDDTTMEFASAEDMSERTLGQITDVTHPFLEKELRAATRTIRNACRWHVAEVQQLTYQRYRPYPETVWLPAMEIASIESVILDGQVIPASSVGFDSDTGWTTLIGCQVKVEFTAGFKEVPEDLVTLTLELAAGGLASPIGISKEQAGGVSVTLDRISAELTDDDIGRLAPYTVGVVP